MENNYVRDYESHSVQMASAFAVLMRKVYSWMALALVVTGLAAYYVANTGELLQIIYGNQIVLYGLLIAEFAIVVGLSAAINKLSFMVASLMFLLYSVINGITLSSIFLLYTDSSIVTTFMVTAGTFAAMALVGSFIKKDLSAIGKFFIFALLGLIIASVVNMFVHNDMANLVISAFGVIIFAGLTAYDTQKIKQLFLAAGDEVNDSTQKLAVLGALTLYLDFINLFLYLLRFLGNRRN